MAGGDSGRVSAIFGRIGISCEGFALSFQRPRPEAAGILSSHVPLAIGLVEKYGGRGGDVQ
jgi:hypothetical protein